jgi:hypothetical protein
VSGCKQAKFGTHHGLLLDLIKDRILTGAKTWMNLKGIKVSERGQMLNDNTEVKFTETESRVGAARCWRRLRSWCLKGQCMWHGTP